MTASAHEVNRPDGTRSKPDRWGYVAGGLTSAVTAALSLLVAPHASLAHVMVFYLLGAVLVAMRYDAAVCAFTIVTSTLCFDYFNIPPRFAFAVPNIHDWFTLGGMLLTAATVCYLIQRLRYQRAVARRSEARTLELCELSLDLSQVTSLEQLPSKAEVHLKRLFGEPSQLLMLKEAGNAAGWVVPEEDQLLLQRAIEAREPCSTATNAGRLTLQPILLGQGVVGVIRTCLSGADPGHSEEQSLLLAACAERIASAMERIALASAARTAQVETEAERLRNELLSAMSHDLKTPLASILTASTSLLDGAGIEESNRELLLQAIVDETERLNNLVTNLLSVTRLESGRVRLNRVPEALDELLVAVLERLSSRLADRRVVVACPDDLPMVSMDPVLMDQVLVNLIENVLRYTPEGSPIDLSLRVTCDEVLLQIADRGPGVAHDEREKVFDKFYRGSGAKLKDGGSGLGLTICRAVARAHGGRIAIHSRSGGGTTVEFALPIVAEVGAARESRVKLLEAALS